MMLNLTRRRRLRRLLRSELALDVGLSLLVLMLAAALFSLVARLWEAKHGMFLL